MMAVDRRTLIRDYKETPRPMGVFRVHNRANDKSFVGASVDIPSMLNRQRMQLRLGGHPNRQLQQDWNAFGAESFEFETLDLLTPPKTPDYDPAEDLAVLESLWLERLAPYDDRGYNVRKKGSQR